MRLTNEIKSNINKKTIKDETHSLKFSLSISSSKEENSKKRINLNNINEIAKYKRKRKSKLNSIFSRNRPLMIA